MESKIMSLKEAVSKYVTDGCSLSIGGLCAREPMAAVYEIIRQKKKNLTFIVDSKGDAGELLIAGGCIKKLEGAYLWIGTIGKGYNFRRAVENSVPNFIEVEEYSNMGISARFLAGAYGLPFMPTTSMVGSSFEKTNSKIKIIFDPYENKRIALVPAARPDVAIIHAQKADQYGNVQLWGCYVNDDIIARAAKNVIITCEEIIPTSEIRKISNMTAIPSYAVSAVVEVPFGCHPVSLAGYYWMDIPFRQKYVFAGKTREGIVNWLNEWIYNIKDHDEYLERVGRDRLDKLKEMELDNYQIPHISTGGQGNGSC